MRKSILTIVPLVLIATAYFAWPLYDIVQLARAIEQRDVEDLKKRVDFVRLRQSFSQQITESISARSGSRGGTLVQGIGVSITDQLLGKLMAPEALADFLRGGWPTAALSTQAPRDVTGVSVQGLGNVMSLFANADYWFGRFEVAVPTSVTPDRAFLFQMRLANWRWRLSSVRLPNYIRAQIVDELAKSRTPTPTP